MKQYITCGTLFAATDDAAETDQTIVTEGGRITFIGPSNPSTP